MRDTFRLGRVAGIPIGVNWTWLIVFGVFLVSLSRSVFPSSNPGLGGGTYAAMAIVAALLFYGSLLLHELGHALQARREGVRIDGITLWLFGGVARLGSGFPSAGAELRIAVAGPLVTLTLAVGLVGLALLTSFGGAVDGVLTWLGYINLSLLVFNLVPAYPLDGGRILRSTLWALRKDYMWATVIAVGVGRLFGIGLMVAGGVLVVTGSGIGGLWLVLLGWFLYSAGAAETGVRRIRRQMG
jgi:Zn-dependent protease